MALLAEAHGAELARGITAIGDIPAVTVVKPTEVGMVMVQGRIGGDGAAFNLGEATVTRMVVQLASGEMGLAFNLGRDVEKTHLAAICDALWQNPSYRADVESHVLAAVRKRVELERARDLCQTAATRVDFFTMVRGEA